MSNVLVINSTGCETRVALVENGVIAEFHIERQRDRGLVGHVYSGRVTRVLPGMQAAFVDIGKEKAAFLYVSDVFTAHKDHSLPVFPDVVLSDTEDAASPADLSATVEADASAEAGPSDGEAPQESGSPESGVAEDVDADEGTDASEAFDDSDDDDDDDDDERPEKPSARNRKGKGPIESRIEEGQHVLVQVAKEPIGSKGARITSHISLPGRYLVYMPTVDHVGISRRIEDETERARLRGIIEEVRPPNTGFIVRTASEGVSSAQLHNDMEVLIRLWREILRRREGARSPALLYQELDLVLRATRDLLRADLDKLVVDNKEDYDKIRDFVRVYMPGSLDQIELYEGEQPIFDAYGLELEIERSLSRKVWLKSGGYIVIDHAEALTVIDVNTGRYVGKKTLEDTIVKINLEAVEEIVYQLRLRAIGGLIIIDFIDMERPSNREKVYAVLEQALRSDRVKTNSLKISEFGLVEMTRKRVRESVVQFLCEECSYCEGKGYVKSSETMAYEIIRELLREGRALTGGPLVVQANPDVTGVLMEEEHETIEQLEKAFGRSIRLLPNRGFHVEKYEISTDV